MAFEFMEVLPVMTMQLAHAGLNLFVAACLGAAIGLERQWRQRLAGLRTNTLVALGAAIFVTYSHVAPDGAGEARIAAQVVSGIGFLGAVAQFARLPASTKKALSPPDALRLGIAPR